MANKKIRATAELFLNTKDAKKDAQIFINDLKGKLQDIESAADKMTVFKDMVEYIAQVDRALAALKANNKDAFAHMFDGLDSNLKAQLEGIFGIDGAKLGKLDVLREQLGNLTLKSSIKEVRSFAKEINTLFTSIGMDAPFENIDEIFSGRTSSEHLKKLGVALANFANVWEDVKSRVSKGFGGGGFGAGTPTISSEIQEEIDKLEEQISHYKSLIDKFKQTAKMKKSFDNFDGVELDFEVSEQAVDGLIKKYNELNDILDRSSSDSVEYANALADRARVAMQLVELNNQLINDGPEKKRLTEFIFNESVEEVALEDFEYEFDDCLKNINTAIDTTKNKIDELKKSASSSFDEFTDGSAKEVINNLGSAVNETGEKVDMLGKKLLNVSEYVSALSGQLKEMFSAAGRSANFEYHIAIDGLDIKARHGSEKSVDLATQTETYLDTLFSDSVLYGHSHRGGTAATNIYDIESVLSSYRDGVAIPVHFVVGKDSITTMDFTGVSKDMVDQLMQEIAATNSNKNAPVINENINKIVEKFTGKSGALKTWNVDQFDDLARYIYDVSSAASSALTPIEKFQAVLDNMFGKGKVDATKYESLLSGLNQDNAKNIFNQIASIENLQPIKTTDMLTMGQVNAEIDESIAKYKALREEANLSYSDIRNEVDKVIEHYKSGGGATSGLDFFQQYFPEGEWQNVRNLLTDAYDNLISLEEVTNRIASEFGVDPDTFAQIPNGAQTSQAVDETNQKLREQEQLWENVKIAIKNGIGETVGLDSLAETLELIEREIKEGILTSIEECIARFKEWNNISEEESLTFIGERERIIDEHNYGTYLLGADEVVGKEEADKLRQLSIQQEQLYQNLRSAIKGTLSDVVDVDDMTYAFDTIEKEIQSGLLTTLDQCIERFQLLTGLDDNRLASIRDGQRIADEWDYYQGDVSSDDYKAAEQAAEEAQKRAEEAEARALEAENRAEEYRSDSVAYQEAMQRISDEKFDLEREIENLREQLSKQSDANSESQLTQVEGSQLEVLQQKLLEVKSAVDAKTQAFEEEYVTVDAAVSAEVASLQELIDKLNEIIVKAGLVGSSLKNIGSNPVQLTVGQSGTTQDEISKTPEDAFKRDKTNQLSALTKYRNSLEEISYVTQETREKLAEMQSELEGIKTPLGLKQFKEDLEAIKKEIALNKSTFETTSFSHLNNARNGLLNTFNSLTLGQKNELKPELDKAIKQLKQYEINVQEGKAVELEAIDSVVSALRQKLDAYKQVNKEARNIETTHKKNSKFGDTTSINATAKYNSLSRVASSEQFEGSKEIKILLDQYTQSYNAMIEMRDRLRNSDVEITNTDKEAFKEATAECNNYAKALDKLIQNSFKLHNTKANQDDYMLGADFVDNKEGRIAALTDFAKKMYDVDVAAEDFKDNWNKVVFAVDNGDNTFTKMTATFTDARNEIVAMAGDTNKAQSKFESFIGGVKNRLQSLSQYFIATVGIYDVWNVIKQGVTHVKEIDSALTELKKVTDETDASYRNFLQDMSKTGAVIGATVKDLTIMAAEWSRLGYSLEESAKLAESTAVLLNVSEFDDATKASEALISTMQAFQYTADESGHVVDVLNEIGNNYAVSSDGIATALQDSASALMEAGNNLEQSVALVAAANKVVQDPNSVGSALRTISLRLRGTSVEILEEMGEETDGVVESISKLQGKIQALTGVNILTDSGAYKETYTILKEIGTVWEDMSDIDQAALLELMAGKNRANTLAAILGNMEDLEGAYNDALDAEGSALKENEAYLDSIQGRIDLFNNSVQTMWMNFIDSEVVKFIVDLGTGLIKLVDAIGLIPAAAGLFAGWKFAAKELEQAFGKTSISTKELKKNLNDYITKQTQEVEASQRVVDAKEQEIVADKEKTVAQKEESAEQLKNIAVGKAEEAQDKKNIATDLAGAEADKIKASSQELENQGQLGNVAVGKAEEKQDIKNAITEQTGGAVGILGKLGSGIKAIGVAFGKAMLVMLAVEAVTYLLGEAWKWLDKEVIHRAENIKAEVEELKNTFESAKETFDDNLKTLTTSSDTKLYETLADEFARLTRGVDQYGNNISLTSDQYERYKEICEQIVGINPKIARGYDSATEAIGNNASVLEDLIRLQKIQARQNVETLLSDENFGKIAEDTKNDTYKTEGNSNLKFYNSRSKAWEEINKAVSGKLPKDYLHGDYTSGLTSDLNGNNTVRDETMAYILKQIGYNDEDEIKKIVEKYYNKQFDEYLVNEFIEDYYAEILDNTEKFGPEYEAKLSKALLDVEQAIIDAEDNIKEAQDGLVDEFLLVPQGVRAGEYYDELNSASKKFITDWIKNSSQFKVAQNQTTEEAIANRDRIIQMVQDLASEDLTTEFNGEQITGQDLLDQLYNLDPSTVDWITYRNQLLNYTREIWNLIGAENNKYGIKDYGEFFSSFGFNFEEDSAKLYEHKKLIQERLKVTTDEINQFISGMNAAEVQAFIKIKWNDIDLKKSDTKEEIMDIIHNKMASVQDIIGVKTYSVLVEEIESYNETLSQTSEIVSDNTEVTQEYKDSLIALGVSEEDLNECFDENNKLIVKDAKALNNLVKSAKNNTAQNIKLAKSQAKLQYYELYKEIKDLVGGQKVEDQATLNHINSLYAEMSALEKTISKYSMLETKLLGAVDAYDKFEEAQEIDSSTDYIGSVEGMVLALGEAFNTAELGSETAQAAIKGLVPESVYEDLDTVDEKMSAIYDYFKNGKLSQYLTLEYDDDGSITSAEMKLGNLRKFIEDGLSGDANGDGINVFEGTDWQHFELSKDFMENIKDAKDPLQEFAEQMDVTKDVAFAFFKSIEDHDIEWLEGDYSSLFDDLLSNNIEYAIYNNTSALADLEVQLANGKITADEYAEKLAELTEASKENAKKARENAVSWVEANKEVDTAKTEVEKLTNELTILKENGATDAEIVVKTNELAEASNKLSEALKKKYNLQEPTEVTIKAALDDINAQMDQWKADNSELNVNVLPKLKQDESGKWTIPADVEATLDESEKAKVQEYLDLVNDEYTIKVLADENPEDSTEELKKVKTAAEEAKEAVENIPDPKINTRLAIDAIDNLQTAIDNITGTTVDIYETTHKKTVYSFGFGESGEQNVNGTAHARGTAYKSGNWGLPQSEHNSLVGELGPEMVVDPHSGRYYTVGDTGAEMVDLPKGAIIFNHKQTESLLKNGYVTSRGKAYAEGNAHVTIWPDASSKDQWTGTGYSGPYDPTYNDDLNNAADSISDAADEFEEVFDWVEVRLDEIDETLGLLEATLENAIYYTEKNDIIDEMIDVNNNKLANLKAGYQEYADYAAELLTEVPEEYRAAAQNGAIAIEEFVGEADEVTLEAIENYREWAEKAADLNQQIEEVTTTIRDLAIQKFDNAYEAGDVRATVEDSQTEKLQNAVDYDEERGLITSDAYYLAMMENSNKKIEYLTNARNAMQEELNAAVEAGQIERGSNEWYELIDQMYQVQSQIDESTIELEEFQNAINDIYWDNFDQLINRLDYLKDETQSLIDLMDSDDLLADPTKTKYEGGTVEYWTANDVEWTDEGLASLGLHAQQMEIAEYTARQYAEAIDDLEEDYQAGLYSENEYIEKLNELKDAQYENIEAYYDAQDAIVELNEARIDSIKEGIEKEIEAYEELIEKQKEQLDAEKDLYDFQKTTADQQKNIANIERQLAALANDNSLSAAARRKQLEQELAEAQYELQDTYYNRSVEDKQTALDQELEKFQEEKDAEIVRWEEYLTNVELVVADSLGIIQDNASGIYDTLMDKAEEYDLTISDAIMTPWQDGALAVSDYQDNFDTAISSTMDKLEALKNKWQEVIDRMAEVGQANVEAFNAENANYAAATKTEPATTNNSNTSTNNQTQTTEKAITVGGKINASGAKIYSSIGGKGYSQYYGKDPIYTVLATKGDWIKVRHHKLKSGVTGWFKKGSVKAYAKGTLETKKDELAWIDELGEELQLVPGNNGRLEYVKKGTGIVPADLTERLMDLAMNPQEMLDRNRPQIAPSSSIVNTEIKLDCSVGTLVNIEHCDQSTLPDVEKIVNKAFDKHMQNLNNSLKRFTR